MLFVDPNGDDELFAVELKPPKPEFGRPNICNWRVDEGVLEVGGFFPCKCFPLRSEGWSRGSSRHLPTSSYKDND